MRAAALQGPGKRNRSRARSALAERAGHAITLSEHGKLWWDGAIVGRLVAGASPLAPSIEMLADEHVKTRRACRRGLRAWLTARIAARLEPLLALRDAAEAKTGTASALPG